MVNGVHGTTTTTTTTSTLLLLLGLSVHKPVSERWRSDVDDLVSESSVVALVVINHRDVGDRHVPVL